MLELRCPNLECLSLWGCTRVEGVVLHCPSLVELNVNACVTLRESALRLADCSRVQYLHMRDCTQARVGVLGSGCKAQGAGLRVQG